ncbi:MAG: penicillin-binding protein 1C [Bacteroidota bacterium]
MRQNRLASLKPLWQNISRTSRRGIRLFVLVGVGMMVFIVADLIFALPTPKSYSQVIYAADSTLQCAYLSSDDKWRLKTTLEDVNEDMVTAIIQKEDRFFYYHPGINPVAIIRALVGNLLSGQRTSGASTITMQVARLREPAPRTYAAKFREMFRAFQLEWHYSKAEILEMYLSYLPYGGNIEGVHAASYLFFDRPPHKLSLSQAVLLAVIPNRPNSLRLDRHPEMAKEARDKWLLRFKQEHIFSATTIQTALYEPVPSTRLRLTPKTPHLCQYLRQKYPERTEVYSSLRPDIQQRTGRLLQNHLRRVSAQGVSNGALLIIDNRSLEVVAYHGSGDFYDEESFGQVDGIHALRSPGSALKPFVYGLGFDLGLVTPASRLLDVPSTYQGFDPVNYDRTFRGQTTLRYALSHSLNIPVVRLGREMGLEPVLNHLERNGFSSLNDQRKRLGLSVVLGGCGVTLEELAHAYTVFARGGQLGKLTYTPKQEIAQERTVSSEGAAYLVTNILSGIERPDLPKRYLEDSNLPKIAWKTGTSYGRRDAWSIGFSRRYTVGVWMGNFDGRGVPEMSGSSMAVPLMLDVFNSIDYQPKERGFPIPPGVQPRIVCAHSGMLPGPDCKHQQPDLFLAGISSLAECNRHRSVFIASDSSLSYCTGCLPDSGFIKAIYPDYEPELVLWFGQNAVAFEKIPPHNPLCKAHFSGTGPQILSPSPEVTYYLEKGRVQEILLQAAADPGVNKLYWYVNGRLLQEALPGEQVFFAPTGKSLHVVCLDDRGRKGEVTVEVAYF